MRAWWLAFFVLSLSGLAMSCDKLSLQEGFPCSSAGNCPSPYSCQAGRCIRGAVDGGAGDVADTRADIAVDDGPKDRPSDTSATGGSGGGAGGSGGSGTGGVGGGGTGGAAGRG